MWVQENLPSQESQHSTIWEKLNPLNLGSKGSPAPVQVDIRWYDGWSVSNFTGHHFSVQEQTASTPDEEESSTTDEDEDDTVMTPPVDNVEADDNSIPEDPGEDEDNTWTP